MPEQKAPGKITKALSIFDSDYILNTLLYANLFKGKAES